MTEATIEWPFPPSLNGIWRSTSKGRGKPAYYLSARYKTWKRVVDNLVTATVPRPRFAGAFTASITLNEAKRGRKDCDNFSKCVLDALQRCGIVENDSLADSVTVRWGHAPSGCRIVLRSTSDPLRRAEGMAG